MNKLPKIKQCIEYIESTGWKFQYCNKPWYVFLSKTRKVANGSSEINMTLSELRHAYKNGW